LQNFFLVAAGFSLQEIQNQRNLKVAATLKLKITGLIAAGFSLRERLGIFWEPQVLQPARKNSP
jgi:hypothetical protein